MIFFGFLHLMSDEKAVPSRAFRIVDIGILFVKRKSFKNTALAAGGTEANIVLVFGGGEKTR